MESVKLPAWLSKPKLSLMLWAGDCVHSGISDVERLAGYDIYLCYGFIPGLEENIEALKRRRQPGVICIIDVDEPAYYSLFERTFKGRFTLIDSDYNGNTPNLSPSSYAELLAPGGQAYNTEGINGVFFPTESLRHALELFAPIISDGLNERRLWTKELIDLAKENRLGIAETWTSPELETYYPIIKAEQRQFRINQEHRYPELLCARHYKSEELEAYWTRLPVAVLCVNLTKAFSWESTPSDWLEPYKQRFLDFLKYYAEQKKCNDYDEYISRNSDTMDSTIAAYQTIITKQAYCASVASCSLLATMKYHDDLRLPYNEAQSNKQQYGVIISKA